MTFREKYVQDHGCWPTACPKTYGYEDLFACDHDDCMKCSECWDREMPEEKEAKENKPVDNAKITITLEFDKLNNFTLASKIFEICEKDNNCKLDPLTIAKMLDAEVCNERRKKDDVQRKIGYGAS